MTAYRTCVGCIAEGQPCERRDAVKNGLRGLGITSVKFKCADRRDRYAPGDPVWVRLGVGGDDGENFYNISYVEFPGHVVSQNIGRAVVFIKDGTQAESGDVFVAKNRGFVGLSVGRLRLRAGDRATMCRACGMPSEKGKQESFVCDPCASAGFR